MTTADHYKSLATALRREADLHEAGKTGEIGKDYDRMDSESREWPPSPGLVGIAFNFWDGWIDARNHDWLYYNGIKGDDWPKLARSIADCLENGRDIDIPIVLRHFDFRNQRRGAGSMMKAILIGVSILVAQVVLGSLEVLNLVPPYPGALSFLLIAAPAVAAFSAAALAPDYNVIVGSMMVFPAAILAALTNLVYEKVFGINGDLSSIGVAKLVLITQGVFCVGGALIGSFANVGWGWVRSHTSKKKAA